jgi:subtilisin family serine protease
MVSLSQLMARTEGRAEITIGLIDGPVAAEHPGLANSRLRAVGDRPVTCRNSGGSACLHGTFIAGMLVAGPAASTPGLCPGCTMLVRPVFSDCVTTSGATPAAVAEGIHRCIDAGAMILNLSSALSEPRLTSQVELTQALDRAATRGVLTIVAAGNEPVVGASALTRHPWVIPVAGYDRRGVPMNGSTCGRSIGGRGLGAPGQGITGLEPGGGELTLDGTSFAAPFVTGTAALLWSLFPHAGAGQVKHALVAGTRRTSVIPPLLNAEWAYQALERSMRHVRQAVRI